MYSGYFGLISEMISKFSQCIISGRDSMLIALLILPKIENKKEKKAVLIL